MIATFHHSDYVDLNLLSKLKNIQNQNVSVVIPALNESMTIRKIITVLQECCVKKHSIIDEIIVIDGNSEDDTVAIAKDAGATTFRFDETGPNVRCIGKGIALWKSQFVTKGDIVIFIDSDLTDFDERFVVGLLGPLLNDPQLMLVKAFYKRPLIFDNTIFHDQGGRVTELLVRPLLRQCIPELSSVYQPLSGEYAIRKSMLSSMSLWSGYSIEIGILLDVYFGVGLRGIAQVDMDQRSHRNRPLHELGVMSGCILRVILEKLHRQKMLTMSEQVHTLLNNRPNSESGSTACEMELRPYSVASGK